MQRDTGEFIDWTFQPHLARLLKRNPNHYDQRKMGCAYNFIERVQLPNVARPAPSLRRQRAAVWLGEVANTLHELPVLAVACDLDAPVASRDARWFVGVVSAAALSEPYDSFSVAPREALLLEAAKHSALPQQGDDADVTLALDLLSKIY